MAQAGSNRVPVLFTSAGRRVELLRAFRRAYETLGLRSAIVATDIDPLAPALQVADRPYLVPRLTEPGYIPALAAVCRRERVKLVFPLIDPDIPVLAAQRGALEATGAQLGVVSPEAAEIAADKWQTVAFFRRLGLPTCESWLPGEIAPEALSYPAFIKPRRGSAAQGTFKVRDARELAFYAERVPDAVIQEFLPGPEITTDVVCDPDGDLLGLCSRRRIEVRSGEVAKGVTVFDAGIAAACVRIAQALPARGPITVQCMLKEGVAHFTEINARFGGGLPVAIGGGVDVPRWLLARAAGLPIEPLPLGGYRQGLYMTRCDESFFLSEADRERLPLASGDIRPG